MAVAGPQGLGWSAVRSGAGAVAALASVSADVTLDPLTPLLELPGVAEAVAASRQAVDRLLGHRVLRRRSADVSAESLLRGAWASAALAGRRPRWSEVRAGAATDPIVQGALRVSTELAALAGPGPAPSGRRWPGCTRWPPPTWLPAEQLGRPRPDREVAHRLDTLAEVLALTRAPAVVVAAIVQGEMLGLDAFAPASGVVARAAARLTLIERGLDPKSLVALEVGHLELRRAGAGGAGRLSRRRAGRGGRLDPALRPGAGAGRPGVAGHLRGDPAWLSRLGLPSCCSNRWTLVEPGRPLLRRYWRGEHHLVAAGLPGGGRGRARPVLLASGGRRLRRPGSVRTARRCGRRRSRSSPRPELRTGGWQDRSVLIWMPAGRAHSVWWFFDDDGFSGWYVNLEDRYGVLAGTADWYGVDVIDHELDAWWRRTVAGSGRTRPSWTAVTGLPGYWDAHRSDEIRAEAVRVIADVEAGRFPFDGSWCDFRPDRRPLLPIRAGPAARTAVGPALPRSSWRRW